MLSPGSCCGVSVDHRRRLLQRVPARAESIGPLRRAVVEFARTCGASDDQCDDIAVAVSEALSNVVEHAYVDLESPGSMAVEASLREHWLLVVVSDDGIGMRGRDSGGVGMGLRLIFELTERLEVEDTLPGARARMTFGIG
jgi:anti-sigma regulatory factor (Ser/Thr protein kinase)